MELNLNIDDPRLKKFLGKNVKISYLDWGDIINCTGILEKINKCSIKVDGITRRMTNLSIEEIKPY